MFKPCKVLPKNDPTLQNLAQQINLQLLYDWSSYLASMTSYYTNHNLYEENQPYDDDYFI